MKPEQAINIAKGCVMASAMDSEMKQAVLEVLNSVAISKTETTSAKKITVDIQLRPLLDDLEVDIDDIKEYINKLD